MKSLLLATCSLGLVLTTCQPQPDLDTSFTEAQVNGTLIIEDLAGSQTYQHDPARALKPYLPASTFKIANTLIALKQGAVKDVDEIIPWDGQHHAIASWNADQCIRSAFPISCVWFYQELAERVGNEVYLQELQQLHYGNELTGPDVRTFWLQGELRISAVEQIAFLKRLYRKELPYAREDQELVRDLMFIEAGPGYTLRAKTGWTVRVDQQIGWYVGWLETGDTVWFFALNMDMQDSSAAHLRKDLTVAALQTLGLLPDPAEK